MTVWLDKLKSLQVCSTDFKIRCFFPIKLVLFLRKAARKVIAGVLFV